MNDIERLKQSLGSSGFDAAKDDLNDIMTALAKVRHSFMHVGLEPPAAILLASHDDGMRFLSAIRKSGNWMAVVGSSQLGKSVEMADGSIFMEIEALGMKVRWPANRIAMPDGSWSYT